MANISTHCNNNSELTQIKSAACLCYGFEERETTLCEIQSLCAKKQHNGQYDRSTYDISTKKSYTRM